MDIDVKRTAVVFKAFCDENRIKILQLLADGEKCACKLLEEMNITQPTLSHHMKILCDSGIVEGRKEGKWMYYSISGKGTEYARKCFETLTDIGNSEENKSCCEK
ncbi:MAG: metalloregulator ArsR/SmtB family transcription factor [Ruminococcus sp.]|nr:metalloregulator ArsR/SmtB family transcription factor [Ruminococcus sp.]